MIGFGYYWLAIFVAGLVMVVLVILQKVIHVNTVKRVEIRFTNRPSALPFINAYMHQKHIQVLDVDFHIEYFEDNKEPERNVYTNLYTLHLPPGLQYADMVMQLTSTRTSGGQDAQRVVNCIANKKGPASPFLFAVFCSVNDIMPVHHPVAGGVPSCTGCCRQWTPGGWTAAGSR